MKTTIYILILVFVSGIIFSTIPKSRQNSRNSITIQCVDTDFNALKLKHSATIISNRLSSFGLKNVKTQIIENKSAIKFSFNKDIDIKNLEFLITQKGNLTFNMVKDRDLLINKLGEDEELCSLLHIPKSIDNDDIISSKFALGYCSQSEIQKINNYISNSDFSKLNDDILLAWSKNSYKDNYSLFILNSKSEIDISKVKESTIVNSISSKHSEIQITLNKEGTILLEKITKSCISKPIAIIMDAEVYSVPIIRSAISGGRILISGGFSKDEVKEFTAIVNNGVLPLDFNVVK
jgi:preprotein translocase subunit SecD